MDSKIIIGALLAIIVIGGGWYFYQESQDKVVIEISEDGIKIDD